jgi:hypothetical protein
LAWTRFCFLFPSHGSVWPSFLQSACITHLIPHPTYFDPEVRGNILLLNVRIYLQDYVGSQSRGPQFE